jgi:hypothetical protein
MIQRISTIIVLLALVAGLPGLFAGTGLASSERVIRLGYLDNPGSALCRIAADRGHFAEEGISVQLVRFDTSQHGLAELESGTIDIGAFEVGDSLRAIAGGKDFRIIAGGGAPLYGNPMAELDEATRAEAESRGVVVLIPQNWPNAEKGTIIQLTAALIRAYRTHHQSTQKKPTNVNRSDSSIHFDPNPDYWRLARIWRALGLQSPSMKRDFLADHVYEEIYCDALDRLLLGHIDQVLQQLFSKAICTPNCCPASAAKL